MKTVFLDIETITNPNLSPELHEALLASVKVGNTKQEHLIAAKQDEAVKKFGLDPLAGIVCCVGVAIDNEEALVTVGTDEPALLDTVVTAMEGTIPPYLVTFNGSQFDNLFLYLRAVALGHNPQFWKGFRRTYLKRYSEEAIDVRSILTNGDIRKNGRLSDWCLMMGIPVPEDGISGGKIQEAWSLGYLTLISEHCRQDITMLRQLYRKMENYI